MNINLFKTAICKLFESKSIGTKSSQNVTGKFVKKTTKNILKKKNVKFESLIFNLCKIFFK